MLHSWNKNPAMKRVFPGLLQLTFSLFLIMIKSDRLLKNSVNNLFYLHPTKCGGVSVYACLNEMNVQFYFTHEIQLNEKHLELLKSDKRIIVTGHIQNLPNPKTDAQKMIMSEILKILYFKSDLIMPTRNPSNLLQSWMHYSKTRSRKDNSSTTRDKRSRKSKITDR